MAKRKACRQPVRKSKGGRPRGKRNELADLQSGVLTGKRKRVITPKDEELIEFSLLRDQTDADAAVAYQQRRERLASEAAARRTTAA